MEGDRPLAGFRVIDFSWSVAGPTVTRNLGILGADVIKIEWPKRPDPMRKAMYRANEENKTLDNGAFFANLNVGKQSLTLNMRDPVGLALAKRLIAQSDLIVDSFAAGVLSSWGLSFDVLQGLRRDIIHLCMSGFGQTGRDAENLTWGPTAQAYNGLTFMSGLPEREPAGWGFSYMDIVAGYMGTIAVLAAIARRDREGEGSYIDMAQVESGLPLSAPAHLDYQVNGRATRRPDFPPGNRTDWPSSDDNETTGHGLGLRGESGAPYGAYPTLGGGPCDWCVISVMTNDHWRALVDVMGSPDWAAAPDLRSHSGRLAAQERIDRQIAAWTIHYEKYELMQRLQRAGVPAGAVQTAEDRMEKDPQLAARDMFPTLSHPLLGDHRFEAFPAKFSNADTSLPSIWPSIGEHTREVLEEALGMSDAEIEALYEQGVLWPLGIDKTVTIERALW